MAAKPYKRDFCVMLNIGPIRHGNNKILRVSKGDLTFSSRVS